MPGDLAMAIRQRGPQIIRLPRMGATACFEAQQGSLAGEDTKSRAKRREREEKERKRIEAEKEKALEAERER